MKSRIFNGKQAEELAYKFFKQNADELAKYIISIVLWCFIKRGRTKRYIKQLYEDMLMILSMDNAFGVEIKSDEIMKRLEQEYDIDFSRIKINIESEKEFKRR